MTAWLLRAALAVALLLGLAPQGGQPIGPGRHAFSIDLPSAEAAPRILKGQRTPTVVASFTASRTTGVSPLGVFFDATGTTSAATTSPWDEVEYQWSYGETTGPGSGSWGQGARTAITGSRNTGSGPISAHVFECDTPPTCVYTVTLTVGDGVTSSSTSQVITVTHPDSASEFATTRTIVMDPSGVFDFTVPTGATQYSATDRIDTANSTYGQNGGMRILLACGQTFHTGTIGTTLTRTGPVYIGKIGSCADPIVRLNDGVSASSGFPVFRLSSASTNTLDDYRFVDLNLDGSNLTPTDSNLTLGVNAAGSIDRVTLLRITSTKLLIPVSNSLNLLDINSATQSNVHVWKEWFIQDCISNDPALNTAGSAAEAVYGYYSAHENSAFLGNNFDLLETNPGSHLIRMEYSGKVVFTDNRLANPGYFSAGSGRYILKQHAPKQLPITVDASTDAVAWTAYAGVFGASVDRPVMFETSAGGTLPAPLVSGTLYWIKSSVDADHFTISATKAGATLDLTTAGTGSQYGIQHTIAWQGIGQGFSRWVYMAHNKIITGAQGPWQLGYEAQDPVSDERVVDVIHEGNWHVAGTGTQYMVATSANNITIRKNLFDMSGSSAHGGVLVQNYGNGARDMSNRVRIYNNDFYSSDADNDFVGVNAIIGTDVILRNNLAYLPSATGGAWVTGAASGSITRDHNTGDAVGAFATDPKFSGGAGSPALNTVAKWRITDPTSYTLNAGVGVPVWADFLWVTRLTGGAIDIGAYKQ